MPCTAYDYDDCDGDYCPVWDECTVIARREHRCCECRGVIHKGERHDVLRVLQQGHGWHTMRRCPCCMVLAEMVATSLEACPMWGLLSEYADEAGIDAHEWRERWNAPPTPEPAANRGESPAAVEQ